jgi:HlyD family secretion protein
MSVKKKALWIAVGVLLVLAVGGFAYYRMIYVPSQVDENGEELQTALVRQGDLVLYASGSGSLIAMDEVELGFSVGGQVAELHVAVGDEVQAGDVLAVQGDLHVLQADVAAAQLAVLDARQALDDLYDNAALVAAQAQYDLATAQDELHTAEYNWTVRQEGNRASESTMDAVEAELEMAREALDRAESRLRNNPDNPALQLQEANAQQKYDSVLRSYNWYTGYPTEIEQAMLDAELALAEAQTAEARRTWEQVKDGPDPDEIARAELELENAEANLASCQQNLEDATIEAPFRGTIMSIDADVGDEVSGTFITLADLSQAHVEIFLDETDMNKIEVGYEAEVIFDALPDLVFTGRVIQVDPSLYESNMLTAVHGIVQLDDENENLETLMIGMNASVDVISARAENAVLVPVEALRELGPEEYAVFVIQDGSPKLRLVEVGIQDVTYAAILSGLEVGETVTTGIVETQ